MASAELLSRLSGLQPQSKCWLPNSIITGLTLSLTQARYQLIRTDMVRGKYIFVPTDGLAKIPPKVSAYRKLKTIDREQKGNFTYSLNTELLGGEQYPILTFVLGTAVGAVSGGAGLLFGATTTYLSLQQTAQRVLAREGDEVWQVEEIGKSGQDVVHVGSYFLQDPFRGHRNAASGWLIHEERTVLTV